MEILRDRKPRAVLAGILLLAGCSSIQENNDIDECGNNGVIEATVDRNKEGYDKSKDPAELTNFMRDNAEQIQAQDNTEEWEVNIRKQVIGIGQIVCRGEEDQLYLTSDGIELSAEYRETK